MDEPLREWETGRTGLIVAEMQTPHEGHVALTTRALMSCDRVILALGSKRKHGIPGHPFTYGQRRDMLRMLVGGDRVLFLDLDDIDSGADVVEWYQYVSGKIRDAGHPEPTDYFGGSRIDAKWYFHAFASAGSGAGIHEPAPSTTIGSRTVWTDGMTPRDGGPVRRLHVLDRSAIPFPSGREIRELIELRDPEWRNYVPERIHAYVERHYPPHLRRPLLLDDVLRRAPEGRFLEYSMLPAAIRRGVDPKSDPDLLSAFDSLMRVVAGDGHPVGTRLSIGGPELWELKDNGRWRPIGRDEKAEWAAASRSA